MDLVVCYIPVSQKIWNLTASRDSSVNRFIERVYTPRFTSIFASVLLFAFGLWQKGLCAIRTLFVYTVKSRSCYVLCVMFLRGNICHQVSIFCCVCLFRYILNTHTHTYTHIVRTIFFSHDSYNFSFTNFFALDCRAKVQVLNRRGHDESRKKKTASYQCAFFFHTQYI